MPRGGARPNSGPAKGTKYAPTLAKEAIREHVRQRVAAAVDAMLDAQILNAQGIKHLLMRDPKTGKFERVATDASDAKVAEAQIDAALQTNNAFWIFTKDPSVQAFTDLLNRTIDKPAEQEQAHAHSGTIVLKHEL